MNVDPKVNRNTRPARINRMYLDSIQRAFAKDPETDFTKILSTRYLERMKDAKTIPHPVLRRPGVPFQSDDARSRLSLNDKAAYVHGPTPGLREILPDGNDLAERIIDLVEDEDDDEGDGSEDDEEMDDDEDEKDGNEETDDDNDNDSWRRSKVIYKSVMANLRSAFRVSRTMVCKFTTLEKAVDEYHALRLLETNLPAFPAPRAHGVVKFACFGLLFSDYVRGSSNSKGDGAQKLSTVWPQLSAAQKQNMSDQIDALVQMMRTGLPRPVDANGVPTVPLGTLGGRGCKNCRGNDTSEGPGSGRGLVTMDDFNTFLLAAAAWMKPTLGTDADADCWRVCAVIDWEDAGYYPDYWEAATMTVGLACHEKNDWFNYLPSSVSPQKYAQAWLLIREWHQCLWLF
ncbi:hypothetical protein SPI_08894 [Niveomyces insectorum RCEF 264]|uniref:Uncharacterized protein n=1 Tax=Niveomyces insectorum RCEF 264 TaxID=1081102 RepID=A0A162IA45_9HYPO|nr:hypothetical protein SPI_08894 [Niveomyces insectorum RCEF 264]